jgi:CheY-like chemotaxis protein
MHILLIEDNPGDIRLTQEAFKSVNIDQKLSVSKDGEDAVKFLFKNHPHENAITPDLIILDLNLPKKTGREILSIIKQDSELKSIPTLILSTSKSISDIKYCYENHANSYLTKPVDLDIFFDMIRNLYNYWCRTVTLSSVNILVSK